MNNNVLVIGNGFDLAHGINTKYEHFINYIKTKSYKSDTFLTEEENEELTTIIDSNGFIKYFLDLTTTIPCWVDFEQELFKITNCFSHFFQNYQEYIKPNGNKFLRKLAGKLLTDILLQFNFIVITDLGAIFQPVYYSDKYGLQKTKIIIELKKHLDGLIRGLEIYLLRCQRAFANNVDNKTIKQIKNIKPNYIISFNYTDTYKIYGIKSNDVFHVHGKLEEQNIVLGFDDIDSEDLDFIYFKKYFQRIQKLTGYINNDHIDCNTIHFYGHSIDKTDGDLIRHLESRANKFIIYTYNQEDYERKVINLIDIFGKEKAIEMIQFRFINFVQCK